MESQNSGNKTFWWVIGVIVVALLVWFGVLNGGQNISPASGQMVKIGVIAPMSGDTGAYGQEVQRVVSYRIDQINQEGGKNGVKFEPVFEDGKCAGNDSASAFQKLATVDGVKFVIGGFCSSETMAIAPLATEQKVLVISPASSNPAIEGLSPYTYSLSYSDSKTGEDIAKEAGVYKRVAIITEQNDFNIGIHDVFVSSMKEYPNTSIVSAEIFPKNNTDFRSILEKVRVTNPDAIILNPNAGVTAQNLLKQLAEIADWNGYQLISEYAYLSDSSRSAVGQFSEGMIIIDAPNVTSDKLTKESDAIVAAKGTLDTIGIYYTASTLDATDLVMDIISEVGNNPQAAKEKLTSGSWDGFIGTVTFEGKNFVKITASGKYVVQNGKAVFQSQ